MPDNIGGILRAGVPHGPRPAVVRAGHRKGSILGCRNRDVWSRKNGKHEDRLWRWASQKMLLYFLENIGRAGVRKDSVNVVAEIAWPKRSRCIEQGLEISRLGNRF